MSENKYIKMLVEHYQNTSNTMLNEMLSIFESQHINLKLEYAVDYIFKSFDFTRFFKHKDKLLQTNVLFNSETKQSNLNINFFYKNRLNINIFCILCLKKLMINKHMRFQIDLIMI